jgi:hypothetical protein
MSLDIGLIASQMLGAALPILEKGASDIESFAKAEFLKIAQTLADLTEQSAAGQIDEQQALLLLDIQKNACRNVFLASEGIGLLTAEAAINAALGVVKTIVNTAIGFALIA